MKRNRVIGAVLALGILAGAGFGFKAMAQSNFNNQNPQNQGRFNQGGMMNGNFNGTPNGNFNGMMGENFGKNIGGFMRGMRGFWNGNQGPELTQDQQKEINTLRAQMQNVMVDYQDKIIEVQGKMTTAITSGVKTDILSAWEEMKAIQLEVQTKIKPTTDQLGTILGKDQDSQNFMFGNFENSYLNQQMDKLKNATTDEDSKTIINELQTGRGQGFRGPGMMNGNRGNRGNGFGGGCHGRGFRR